MWHCVTGRLFHDVSAYFCGFTFEKFIENEAEVDITVAMSITEDEIS
jgi:hypothetical protein